MAQSRRSLLTTALVMFAGYHVVKRGLPVVSDLLSGGFEFEALDRPSGFRRIEGGKISAGFDPFVGLQGSSGQTPRGPTLDEVEARLCQALFQGNDGAADILPIASFSDYNCPYCRILTERLALLETEFEGRVKVVWHELPLLGPSSLFAARAALAAQRQGAYLAFHKRMMNARLIPTPGFLRNVANDIGISPRQMLRDMDSVEVSDQLAETAALGRLFGVVGTPALVLGRTLVQGAITDRELTRLIKREWQDGPVPSCDQA